MDLLAKAAAAAAAPAEGGKETKTEKARREHEYPVEWHPNMISGVIRAAYEVVRVNYGIGKNSKVKRQVTEAELMTYLVGKGLEVVLTAKTLPSAADIKATDF